MVEVYRIVRKGWTRLRGWSARHPIAVSIVPGMLVLAGMLALQAAGAPLVERLGLGVFDSYQRAAPRAYKDAPVRIVDIDDETIRRMGQWPWPREEIGRLTRALTEAGAAVVAYDVVFSEPDRTAPARLGARIADPAAKAVLSRLPDPDATLAADFGSMPVVLGYFLSRDGGSRPVPPKAGFAVTGTQPRRIPRFESAIPPLPGLVAAAAGTGW